MTLSEVIATIGKYILLPFAGGLIGAAIKGWIENRRFFKLENSRNIFGRWKGELNYLKPRWPNERIEIEFYPKRFFDLNYWLNSRLIKGAILSHGDPSEELMVRGGFYQADQLMFDYRSAEINRRQFGSLILNLDASGHTLIGNFVGYFDEPLVGTLRLKKVG
jgi:hypothetical protein